MYAAGAFIASSELLGDLGVDVHRECHDGVAEDFGDDLGRLPGGEQHGRGAVPQIGEADGRQPIVPRLVGGGPDGGAAVAGRPRARRGRRIAG